MKDKTIVIVSLLVASLMLSIAPAFAFYHIGPPPTEDGKYEIFGPRVDRILIKMYGTLQAEMAALQAGEIDITDWPLDKPLIDTLSADPNVVVLGYGGEAGYYVITFQNNNNQYLGNPPNPSAPNPLYPNPCSVVSFRQALAHMIDQAYLCSVLAEGLFDPIYLPIPAYMAFWTNPEIRPGGALESLTYPYDGPAFTNVMALLDDDGFPLTGNTGGYRYWDRNSNGVEDSGEAFQLKVATRADKLRREGGNMLVAGLEAVDINYLRTEYSSGAEAKGPVMVQQNANIYTSGWIYIGPDGDYLYDLYSYDNYYWDGQTGPANWEAIGKYNAAQNAYLMDLKNAPDATAAQTAAFNFEVSFASDACEIGLGSTAAPKAFHKTYTGGNNGLIVDPDDGENAYRGDTWDNIVNQKGIGENSWWSTLNMHPIGHEFGDGSHMTVRYGWEQLGYPSLINPIYSSWYWESEIYGRVMDGGGARNPYTLGPVEVPQLMENWTQGTWLNTTSGQLQATVECRMRPDVLWNDGIPMTVDDFIYTLAILPNELVANNCSQAWWQPTLDQVAAYWKLDAYTARILMKTNTFLASTWIVGNAILPKHWWQPFIAAHPMDAITIQGDISPLIGTGPFLYTALVPSTSATLDANPLYYQPDEVGVIKEDPRSGIDFAATGLSSQISPVKIKDYNIAEPGLTGGTFDLKVLVQNLNKLNPVTYHEKITLTYMGPNAAGAPTVLHEADHTLVSGGIFLYTQAMNVNEGLWKVDVTVTKVGGVAHTSTKNVYVTVAGDLNGDWKVNILDITPIAIRFGSNMGTPSYDQLADLNRDGKINILDIVQVALVFGWTAFT